MTAKMVYLEQLDEFRRMPAETEWLEFKEAKTQFDNDELGRYVTALSNEANLCRRDAGWLIFGVKDKINPSTKIRLVVGSSYATRLAPVEAQAQCGELNAESCLTDMLKPVFNLCFKQLLKINSLKSMTYVV